MKEVSSQKPLSSPSSSSVLREGCISSSNTISPEKIKHDLNNAPNTQADMPINSFMTRIVTKTLKSESHEANDEVTESVERVLETVHPIAQSSLPQHGFLLPSSSKDNEGEHTPIIISKYIKKTAECKNIRDMKRLINSLEAYVPVTNNPLATKVAKQILDSDILFLHLKEIDDDDIEPIYEMIGSNAELCRSAAQYDSQDYKIHQNCTECYHN